MTLTGTKADFSQNNPAWAGQLLGFSTWENIGPFGCLVTAFANVAQAQGSDLNPSAANDALKAHGLFVCDAYGQVADVAGYAALAAIAPHSHFVEQKNWPAEVVAPAAYFDVRNTTATEIIIMIDAHPEQAGIQSHYCRVVGLASNGQDLEIVDSWDGQRKLLSAYANRANKKPFQIIWTAGKYQQV